MHIGLIGGIGPAATDFYHRRLIERHAASGLPLDLTIAYADARVMTRNMADRNPGRQAEIFVRLVNRLKAAGADAAAVTSMGGHFCIRELETISPLPILNALPVIDAELARRKLSRIGIIGTRNVMESGLYGSIAAAEMIAPEGEERDRVHQAYVDMAMIGRVADDQRAIFFEAGRRLCHERGAEAVLLGGTDLFIAFDGHDAGFPVIDGAAVHAEAIFNVARGS